MNKTITFGSERWMTHVYRNAANGRSHCGYHFYHEPTSVVGSYAEYVVLPEGEETVMAELNTAPNSYEAAAQVMHRLAVLGFHPHQKYSNESARRFCKQIGVVMDDVLLPTGFP